MKTLQNSALNLAELCDKTCSRNAMYVVKVTKRFDLRMKFGR